MSISLTSYHAQYFAYELTRSRAADDQGKFTASLQDATVDLNPHQVEAALFAFKSPLSKGALLADEVGLGKTIEAGIILSQKWAERKRKLLIIAPANLRKQWNQELADKFFLPSTIIEAKSFNQVIKSGNLNPFEQNELLICSYQFARSKESYLRHVQWDLVIIDEAHRLRNVYRPDNKIGKSIKSALAHTQKVLLTATPLQNSLLELYGLVVLLMITPSVTSKASSQTMRGSVMANNLPTSKSASNRSANAPFAVRCSNTSTSPIGLQLSKSFTPTRRSRNSMTTFQTT